MPFRYNPRGERAAKARTACYFFRHEIRMLGMCLEVRDGGDSCGSGLHAYSNLKPLA